ncbi:hypothetical protein RUE5091_04024 [Ruegeria denitrificans]|uniref:Uncharacterized protein n=1 Tax=Ruegeria denitrificans TaxID=1715692 RepID=A0A0P1IJH3_9RHOB|nr:hypothetical protein RUE5091_04024 [Ruegeria denitrificans]
MRCATASSLAWFEGFQLQLDQFSDVFAETTCD